MNHNGPEYRYCPYDGERLTVRRDKDYGRPCCRKCGFVDYQNPLPCVAILIVKKNKVLLARRAHEPAKGLWDIPGGFIEHGESAEQTVVREALEETGLHVRVLDFLGSIPDTYGDREFHTLTLCFIAEVIKGRMRPASDVDALAWFSFKRLPSRMAFSHQRKALKWCNDRIAAGVPHRA